MRFYRETFKEVRSPDMRIKTSIKV